MKKLSHLLVLILVLPSLVFGQTIDPNPNSIDSSFSNPTNLSDKQMDEAKNFVHQGQKDRVYKEGCAKINDCKDEEGFPLEMLIGKAYSVIGMFAGGGGGFGPQLTQKPTDAQVTKAQEATKEARIKDPKAAETKPDQDKKPDYCMMMSMAYEAVGAMIQQDLQKKAQNTTVKGDEQLQSLVSLQETHKARQKTATIQSAVYGAVTTCYAAQLMWGNVDPDGGFILKMGGAAALTGLFIRKSLKHKKAAEKVGEVIASLDKAGKDCNPWTKSACFCSEPTSKDVYPSQFQEVCVLNNGNFETPKIALGCTSVDEKKKLNYDKECKCKASNTCMKANLQLYNPQFGMGTNLMAESNQTFDMISKGEVDTAVLDRATLKASAVAAKVMPKSAKIKTSPLTPQQAAAAKDLSQYMPPQAAAAMASAQPTDKNGILSSGFGSSAISKLPASVKEKLAEAIDVDYNNGGGGSSYSKKDDDFEMPVFGGQESAKTEGVEVLSFAEKAISKADVSNSPETPIFDIISNRYRRSGWTKLDTEGK